MLKKSFIVVAAVAVMALPAAALGDGGTPDPGAKIAAAQAKLEAIKAKCDAHPKAAARCAKVAAAVVARLDMISARIDKLETTINTKCSVATPPAKCSQAPALLQRLDTAKQDIAQLEAWIQANFTSSAPAPAPAPQ
jgi:hypothetical protein